VTEANENTPAPRSLEMEVEVPGTPEQVWETIATGPGITCWFVPAEVGEREGGTVAWDFGWGMEETGVVTGWEPPRRFAYEEEWPSSEEAPPARLATEWLVEARSGGTCVVRMVSNLFASGDEWDDQLEDMRTGWAAYFHNLRLYLGNFAGRRCSTVFVTGSTPGSKDEGWAALTGALGLGSPAEGEHATATASGAPALAGLVERVSQSKHHGEVMLRLDEPAPGTAFVFVVSYQGQTYTMLHAYLFGDEAPSAVARDEPAWQAWMEERFPAAKADAPAG
jgi:uncharacterized protein YndB with AHSA1/START domain